MIDRITDILRKHGADIVAPADIRETPPEPRGGLPRALVIGEALDPHIIVGISEGPTWEYYHEYCRANALLSELARLAARMLVDAGYRADPLEPTSEKFDKVTLSARFSHKMGATRAGIGWIGKNDLLVTPGYGSAVRYATVLTDADLGAAEPVNRSRCGSCTACVDACPGHAPSGKLWDVSLGREDFFDVRACHRTACAFNEANGFGHTICGICIAVCPWTKKYIESALSPAAPEGGNV